jgi:hypothetical protein
VAGAVLAFAFGLSLVAVGCGSPSSPSQCAYALSPSPVTPCMTVPAQYTFQLSTTAGCSWVVSTSASWMALLDAATGTGARAVRVQISSNWDAPREGAVTVMSPQGAGAAEARIRQAGCYYGLSQEAMTFGPSGGQGMFDVLQQSDPMECGGPLQNACWWSAVADVPWLSIVSTMPRVGDDRVTFVVAANGTGADRFGTITVRSKQLRVTQH